MNTYRDIVKIKKNDFLLSDARSAKRGINAVSHPSVTLEYRWHM